MKLSESLIGYYVWTFSEDGELKYQARIVGIDKKANQAIVQLHECLMGEESDIDRWHPSVLVAPRGKLFATGQEWRAFCRWFIDQREDWQKDNGALYGPDAQARARTSLAP